MANPTVNTVPRESDPSPDRAPALRDTKIGRRCSARWRSIRGTGGLRLLAAVAGGLGLYFGSAPRTWWWSAIIGLALIGGALHGRRIGPAIGLSFVAGAAFYLPLLSWTGVYVGSVPWLGLALLEAITVAPAGVVLAIASRRLPAWPVFGAAAWVMGEAIRARFPFGGFPWGTIAFTQPDGPLLAAAAVIGSAGLSFLTALAGFALWELATSLYRIRATTRQLPIVALVAALPFVVGLASRQAEHDTTADPQQIIAVIQGNVPRAGLEFNAQRRAVLDNHVTETKALAAAVRAGTAPQPTLVIWPENSSDIDPYTNADAYDEISAAAVEIGVPIVVGAVVGSDTPRRNYNMGIVWDPVTGPGQTYTKKHPVPFGEYMPWRSFFRIFSDKVDLLTSEFLPGTSTGNLDVAGVNVGDVICFEVVYDDLVRDVVEGGAQLLVVQTNNATFGYTDETYQQLAMSRVRAVEHGREVVVAATSGVSAVIRSDGFGRIDRRSVHARLPHPVDRSLHRHDAWHHPRWAGGMVHHPAHPIDLDRCSALASPTPSAGAGGIPGRRRPDMTDRVLVIIPTYNERENLPLILGRLFSATPLVDALVVDDGSPDGTGQVADEWAAADPRVHALHRTAKNGLGKAYIAGFRWGLEQGYDVMVEMDADGSHAPEDLPRILKATAIGDLVIGSRYVAGGKLVNWPWHREFLSKGANLYARLALGVGIHDITAGYRAYSAEVLRALPLDTVESAGYCFQIDLAWRTVKLGFQVIEVPITFSEREIGVSKMSGSIVSEALIKVTRWGLGERFRQLSGLVRRS